MLSLPLVTIIIPTYNRANKVGDAIASVLNQTYKNIQLIVIDDGSDDHTSTVVKQYPQAMYIIQKHAGQAAARNNGLKNASGELIANLDSDDIWEPQFLELCIRKLEEDNLDFVFANWEQEFPSGRNWSFLKSDPFLKPFFAREKDDWINLDNGDLRKLYLKACPSPSSSVILRKSSIVSGWDEKINIGDDWALYLDMILSKECKVAFTLNTLWKKRVDTINIYDGRLRAEVLSLLYIADLKTILNRHANRLSCEDIKILEQTRMFSLVELSKHKLIREFRLIQSLKLIKDSFSINTLFTFKAIYIIFLKGVKIRVIRLLPKESRINYEHRNVSPRIIE